MPYFSHLPGAALTAVTNFIEGIGAIGQIIGAIVFLGVLFRGGISFIRNRCGFCHPTDFL
ncbi:hypothetical protein BA190_13105 [Labrys sp. WJW]|nr:hypothetical protein BA190_13105 [Labrys sp. WJW]